MIRRIIFRRYKAFHHYSLNVQPRTNVLVGPNNAGKSTAISIARLTSLVLRTACRINPSIPISDGDRNVIGYPLALSRINDFPGYSDANVHHEFRNEEARVEAHFSSGSRLYMVWPKQSDDIDPYFYFDYQPGMNAKRRQQVSEHAPLIGVIPGLSPVEDQEDLLTEKYVAEATGSRLTSRHFRNSLHFLKSRDPVEYRATLEFIYANTPEITDISISTSMTRKNLALDLFFREAYSNSERELFWAGDGLQIWLQILFHAFRQRKVDTLVLDEPDVFLHPDLQRRLIHILDDLGPQIILATHASEVIAEAPDDSIILVDRSKRTSRRVTDTPGLDQLVAGLGSAFDLAIARALRSRVVVFVEGRDMKILRTLAGKVGANQLSKERGGVSVVPLGGYSNWPHVEPFAQIKNTLLQDTVEITIFLDRDYRDESQVLAVERKLREMGISPHIWRRKEVESYLLEVGPISRISGLSIAECQHMLTTAINNEEQSIESKMFSEMLKVRRGDDPSVVHSECRTIFRELWDDEEARLSVVPPKQVISQLNNMISEAGGRTLSVHKLSSEIRSNEIAVEMREALISVEDLISARRR